ncbi:hypothetical protein [Candidatus Tisiphia endosymbiont of Ptychoptera albimana]|jgi:hypothetical protein|uniref:hypothetical protein n=1 Tax=Candidatus Tisiphia endosymbiont of Ptychoptera albimana TaxID=3066260 RepID=UPI001E0F7B45|nr:hypothetical protein [Rickettsia endosymbiont of Labidopullus appendiculatus]HJD57320.1 hypothetical protein [Rickettsia endosymbiont of Sericostoma sp. HW-2014]
MKDTSQLLTPTNILQEDSNEVQEEKKKHHNDRKKLPEETLKKIVKHYELAKQKAELISHGL